MHPRHSPATTPTLDLSHPVLTEVRAIQTRLQQDADTTRPRTSTQTNTALRDGAAWTWTVGAASLFTAGLAPRSLVTTFLLLAGVSAIVSVVLIAILGLREWRRRDEDTLRDVSEVTLHEAALINDLLTFSRGALLHTAAGMRAAEARVAGRVGLVLGGTRAGGILGLLFLTLGLITTGKYLQENKVALSIVGAVTPTHVLVVAGLLFLMGLGVLLAGYSVGALTHYAELLERTAALKKNLADDAKEKA